MSPRTSSGPRIRLKPEGPRRRATLVQSSPSSKRPKTIVLSTGHIVSRLRAPWPARDGHAAEAPRPEIDLAREELLARDLEEVMTCVVMSSPRRARAPKRSMIVSSAPASIDAPQLAWLRRARASAESGQAGWTSSRRRRPTSVWTSLSRRPPECTATTPRAPARVTRLAGGRRGRKSERTRVQSVAVKPSKRTSWDSTAAQGSKNQ